MPEAAIGYHALILIDHASFDIPMQTIFPATKDWLANHKLLMSALAACCSFVLMLTYQAWYFPPVGDDAFVATTAKNAALGYGWVSSYGTLLPFDPEITTGPGLLGFLSMGIKVFGNTLWLPRVFSLGLNLALAALLLWRLRRWLPAPDFLWLLILLPLLFANLRYEMWVTALGDMPVVLYSALAAMLVFEGMENGQRRFLLAGGLAGGLALLTKTIALIPITGVLMLPWLYALMRIPILRSVWQQSAYLAIGLALAVLPWFFYTQSVMNSLPEAQLIYLENESRRVFLHMGSGLGRLLDAWQGHGLIGAGDILKKNIIRNIPRFNGELAWQLGPIPWPFAFFSTLFFLAATVSLAKMQTQQQRLRIALLLPALTYLLWLLFFSDWIFGRHAYIGIFLGAIGLVLIASHHHRTAAGLSVYFLLLALFWPAMEVNFGKLYRIHGQANPVRIPLLNLAEHLQTNYPEATLAGCGYHIAREVEYVLPTVNRIVDCHRLIGEVVAFDYPAFIARYPELATLDEQAALQRFINDKKRFFSEDLIAPIQWRGQTNFILVHYPLARRLNGWGLQRPYGDILRHCQTTLYDDGFYALQQCRQEDLEAYVNELGGLGFAPPQWQLQLWLEQHGDSARIPPQ